MSAPTVAEYLLGRLGQWGVQRIYGYPDDGSNGLNLAVHRSRGCPELVQTRHEELAAFVACAHATRSRHAAAMLSRAGGSH